MTVRTALRTVVLTATTAVLLLPATPVFAATVLARRDDGEDPGGGLSVLQTLGIYVGIPLGLFVVISLLAAAPGMSSRPRYRPGVGWWAAPVWFNGPADPEQAVRETTVGSDGGGTSARW